MHQTTVRFGPDLWEALEAECADLGMSAAQYVREATLARLAYSAGRRGDPLYEAALAVAGVPNEDAKQAISEELALATDAGSSAWSQQVWRRARAAREQAAELRGARSEKEKVKEQ
jgi:hypothetical protein